MNAPDLPNASPESVITWPVPAGEIASPDFTVEINGRPIFVYQAPVRAEILKNDGLWTHLPDYDAERASFVIFDQTGSVRVRVKPAKPFTTAAIRPERLAIPVTVRDGVVEFTLEEPRKVTVLLDGDDRTALHLFAGQPESDPPSPADPNVLYYGPGVHETTGIELKSGQTLYLAGGAILRLKTQPGETGTYSEKWKVKFFKGKGIVVQGAEQVTVRGRGIIDASLVPHPGFNTIRLDQASRVRIEGVTLRNAANWNVIIGNSDDVEVRDLRILSGRLNTDGINTVNSRKVRVLDCFVRNHDDSIVVKTTSPDSVAEEIWVEDCVIWNDWGYALGVSYETRAPIRNVTFRNNDIIQSNHWCLGVYLSDSATVENIRFENTHLSDLAKARPASSSLVDQPMLIRLAIAQDVWGHDAERGRIRNVVIDGVTLHGSSPLSSSLEGADAGHDIRGVTLRDIHFAGQEPMTREGDLNLRVNSFVSDLTLEGKSAPER